MEPKYQWQTFYPLNLNDYFIECFRWTKRPNETILRLGHERGNYAPKLCCPKSLLIPTALFQSKVCKEKSSGNAAFASRVEGLKFKSRAGQIGHSIDNGSPSLRHFFERSCVASRRNNSTQHLLRPPHKHLNDTKHIID